MKRATTQHLLVDIQIVGSCEVDKTILICFISPLFLVPNYELSRNLIDLQEIIGYGHFGDVHRGFFRNAAGEQNLVAVKTCKDQTQADKFLEEACKCLKYIFIKLFKNSLILHYVIL